MISTKLVHLLRTFTKAEFADFEAEVSIHYTGKKKDLKGFFLLLKKHYPKFDDPEFTKESVFKSLYPNKKFEDIRIRKLLSFTYKLAEDFLAKKVLKENDIVRDLLMLSEYRSRNLDKSFKALSAKIDNELSNSKISPDKYYNYRTTYYQEMLDYYAFEKNFPKSIEYQNKLIENITSHFLLTYYITTASKTAMESSYPYKMCSDVLEGIRDGLETDKFLVKAGDNEVIKPVVPFYYAAKALANTDDIESYRTAKKLFLENIDKFTKGMQYGIFLMLIIFNTARKNHNKNTKTDEETAREILNIQKLQLEHGALIPLNKRYMSPIGFRNMLLNAIHLDEFEWAEEFMESCIKLMEPKQRDNMERFSMAYMEFAKKNFSKSLDHASGVKYETFFFKKDIMLLNFMLYFELELYERAHYYIDTTQKYYSGTKEMVDSFKESHENFLRYYKILLRYIDKQDKDILEMNYIMLKAQDHVKNKKWLMNKYEGILKK